MTRTGKRLEALTANLVVPPQLTTPTPGPAVQSNSVETRFPPALPGTPAVRTGPGQMLAFRGQMLEAEGEAGKLRERLAQFEGALPTRKVDPKNIIQTRWANRHEAAFETAEFARLKSDIEQAGGNVQPILVRAVEGKGGQYEIVFGHRRHRACLELGIRVLASIWTDPLSDSELFAAMDRENRERSDLSAYEQGTMYQRALDEQLFASQRRLAEALGVSHTWVRKAITVAQLPPAIVECFKSPLEIQHRHAEQISAALEVDRKLILRRADKLRGQRLSAAAVVSQLLTAKPVSSGKASHEINVAGKSIGQWSQDERGAITIRLVPGAIAGEQIAPLIAAIAKTAQA